MLTRRPQNLIGMGCCDGVESDLRELGPESEDGLAIIVCVVDAASGMGASASGRPQGPRRIPSSNCLIERRSAFFLDLLRRCRLCFGLGNVSLALAGAL